MKIYEIINSANNITEGKKRRKKRAAYSGPGYVGFVDSSGEGGGDGGGVAEAWSEKYKRSINCARPRGFSQRAHCQGRKKK